MIRPDLRDLINKHKPTERLNNNNTDTNNNNDNNNNNNQQNNVIKRGWNKSYHVSIQHINLYELSEVTASIIKYTSMLITLCKNRLIIC